ncbi:MAG: DUF4251 domain-containing protein [Bergeyella sp.]
MKKIISLSIFTVLLFVFSSCSSNKIYQEPTQTKALLESGTFTFVAERANPSNMDVINVLNTTFPSGGGASRVLNLDSGYTMEVSPEKVSVRLPYFGRMYTASMDPKGSSYDFTSEKFRIDTSKSNNKKSVWIFTFGDVSRVQQLFLEVFPGGKAFVSINSNDRQAISYDGYVTETKNPTSGK